MTFALKIILKNVERMDVTHSYVNLVIFDRIGESAMMLALRAGCDFYSKRQ